MEYVLKLTQEEIQIIANALGEQPLKTTVGVFGKLQQQVQAQVSKSQLNFRDDEGNENGR